MIPSMFLRNVEMFDGLTDGELEQIRKICEEIDIDDGSTVFQEKDQADYLYTLTEGEVSLRFNLPGREKPVEHMISKVSAGNTFGWSALVAPYQYTLAAYCTGKSCKAIRLKRSALERLMEENHTIGYKLLKNLNHLMGRRFLGWIDEVTRQIGQNNIDGW